MSSVFFQTTIGKKFYNEIWFLFYAREIRPTPPYSYEIKYDTHSMDLHEIKDFYKITFYESFSGLLSEFACFRLAIPHRKNVIKKRKIPKTYREKDLISYEIMKCNNELVDIIIERDNDKKIKANPITRNIIESVVLKNNDINLADLILDYII